MRTAVRRAPARLLEPAQADAFLGDVREDLPAIERDITAIAVAHAYALSAAVDLAWLRHAKPNCGGRGLKIAQVLECSRHVVKLMEVEFAATALEPLRVPR